MPSMELKIAAEYPSRPTTCLRRLLETPGAAILRRNHVPDIPGYDDPRIRNAFRIAAVLAVDLSNPPQDAGERARETEQTTTSQNGIDADGQENSHLPSFAKGIEVWIANGGRTTRVLIDEDEISGALAMFDAYVRLGRYLPAFQRLEERKVGLHYGFREGLTIVLLGPAVDSELRPDALFESTSAIAELSDFRASSFTIRLAADCIGYLHDSLRASAAWLEENSYANMFGSK